MFPERDVAEKECSYPQRSQAMSGNADSSYYEAQKQIYLSFIHDGEPACRQRQVPQSQLS
jgi:hypothetical protein